MRQQLVVYGLRDPDTLRLRYVGKSEVGAEKRLEGHLQEALKVSARSQKSLWIRGLVQQGKRPVVEVIEEYESPAELVAGERRWIEFFVEMDFDLLNQRDGARARVDRMLAGTLLQDHEGDTEQRILSTIAAFVERGRTISDVVRGKGEERDGDVAQALNELKSESPTAYAMLMARAGGASPQRIGKYLRGDDAAYGTETILGIVRRAALKVADSLTAIRAVK